MRINTIMTQDVVTVSEATPLRDVAGLLVARRISGVPVVAGETIVGIVSKRDIVAHETGPDVTPAATAGDAMSSPVHTAEPWMSVWAAADLMIEKDVGRLPVVQRGRLLGMVTRTDLVRAFARSDAAIERDIRDTVLGSFGLAPTALEVHVDNGAVTLAGVCDWPADVEALPRAVRRITGVVTLDAHLRPRVPAAA